MESPFFNLANSLGTFHRLNREEADVYLKDRALTPPTAGRGCDWILILENAE